ncbi:MAG: VCBS repeat-containing protein [Flavitalea sp.]
MKRILIYSSLLVFILCGCKDKSEQEQSSLNGPALFSLVSPDSSNILFSNNLTEAPNTNVLLYEYFYNGGGVAVGDLNDDGLEDIYFTANMSDSKLYLNKGNFKFEDITLAAGVNTRPAPWRTGVTIADVNGDGKRDIHVSYSGKVRGANRVNQLFINKGNNSQGIPTFEDMASQYGLADSSYTTQAFFFDYDKDGDLDMFSLNHNPENMPVLDEASTSDLLKKTNPLIGVRMYENRDNFFTDITEKAGISSSMLTYGLGAGIADINGDGWQDIYIANDYNVPDFIYINNQKGGFENKLTSMVGHTSQSSMGNNISDINNDGYPDILVLDMLPEDNHRKKLLLAPDNYEKFDLIVRSGFHYQYMRNMLQLNNGDGTFSEIGQLAGISNTDWSWAPLIADFDNDGWKDIFVTNGYLRDFTNMDFLKFMNDYVASKGRLKREDVLEILQKMPSSNVTNYAFRNKGDLSFENVGNSWGINTPTNSNGAVYADLDNDGDLDLIVNNINQPAGIYKNGAEKTGSNFISLKITGEGKNTDGLGAKVFLYNQGKVQYAEQMPARGYQSTVTSRIHFGLGNSKTIDSIKITWLSGKEQLIVNPAINKLIELKEVNAVKSQNAGKRPPKTTPIFNEENSSINVTASALNFNDYKRQPLLVGPLSTVGPCLVKADVNNDGLEDIYAGGDRGIAGALYLQQKNGKFIKKSSADFEKDKESVDADAVFFDANKDGYPDLYVASGGYHDFQPDDVLLEDRLYLNDGKGEFKRSLDALPSMKVSKGTVAAADVNGDGFEDVFVGGRVIPGRYPETPESFLLINDGKGKFSNQINSIAPALQKIGMITDAVFADLNADKQAELIIAGEWMPLTVFMKSGSKFENKTTQFFDQEFKGWWNTIHISDLNKDGQPDLVAGNMGLNTQCKVSDKQPAELFFNDFDNNGSVDPILNFYVQGKSYPYVTRDELLDQMSMMRNRFPDYKSYADLTMNEIFSDEERKNVTKLEANYLSTAIFIMENGKWKMKSLPVQAQFSPVHSITEMDYDKDGNMDLLLGGNQNMARLSFGKSDANYGQLYKGNGKGQFEYISQQVSGFQIRGDVRSLLTIGDRVVVGIHQSPVKMYKIQ